MENEVTINGETLSFAQRLAIELALTRVFTDATCAEEQRMGEEAYAEFRRAAKAVLVLLKVPGASDLPADFQEFMASYFKASGIGEER